jgi:nicotinamidase-related amidase
MASPAQTLLRDDALLVVDVQVDFLPGGALAVPAGDEVVPALNRHLRRFRAAGRPVVLTRDWHPEDHCSFHTRGGPWPPHCVRGTPGAAFAPGLEVPAEARLVSKATGRDGEAYSGFGGTDLHAWLQAQGVHRLFVGGLATDYCVLATVRDALGLGYAVVLLLDSVRAVDVCAGDGERAVAEMFSLGAEPLYAD